MKLKTISKIKLIEAFVDKVRESMFSIYDRASYLLDGLCVSDASVHVEYFRMNVAFYVMFFNGPTIMLDERGSILSDLKEENALAKNTKDDQVVFIDNILVKKPNAINVLFENIYRKNALLAIMAESPFECNLVDGDICFYKNGVTICRIFYRDGIFYGKCGSGKVVTSVKNAIKDIRHLFDYNG